MQVVCEKSGSPEGFSRSPTSVVPSKNRALALQVRVVRFDSRSVCGSSRASFCFIEWTLSLDGFSCCRGEQSLSVPQCQPSDCLYPHPPGPLRECSPWRWPLGKIYFPLQGPAILSNPIPQLVPPPRSQSLHFTIMFKAPEMLWELQSLLELNIALAR